MEPRTQYNLFILVILVPLVLLGYAIWQQNWTILIAIAVIAALLIGIYHLIKFLIGRHLTASMVPHKKEIDELTEQYKAKNAEATQSVNRYKAIVQELMDMDPVLPEES